MKVTVVQTKPKKLEGGWYIVFVSDSQAWRVLKRVAGRLKKRSSLERYGFVAPFQRLLPKHPKTVEPPLFFEDVEEFRKWVAETAASLFRTKRAKENVLRRLEKLAAEANEHLANFVYRPRGSVYAAVKYACFADVPASYHGILKQGSRLAREDEGKIVRVYEFKPSYMIVERAYYGATTHFLFIRKTAHPVEAAVEIAQLAEAKKATEMLRDAVKALEKSGREGAAEARELLQRVLSAAELLA